MKSGNVEIVLPKKEQVLICCSRVGEMKNGEFVLIEDYNKSNVDLNTLDTAEQLEKAAKRIEAYVKSGFLIESDEEGIARVYDLEEGVYLLNSIEKHTQGDQKILPTLLYLPSWDESEGKMLYDITVIPKYGVGPPETGDNVDFEGWCFLLLTSTVIISMILGLKMKKSTKKEECF